MSAWVTQVYDPQDEEGLTLTWEFPEARCRGLRQATMPHQDLGSNPKV